MLWFLWTLTNQTNQRTQRKPPLDTIWYGNICEMDMVDQAGVRDQTRAHIWTRSCMKVMRHASRTTLSQPYKSWDTLLLDLDNRGYPSTAKWCYFNCWETVTCCSWGFLRTWLLPVKKAASDTKLLFDVIFNLQTTIGVFLQLQCDIIPADVTWLKWQRRWKALIQSEGNDKTTSWTSQKTPGYVPVISTSKRSALLAIWVAILSALSGLTGESQ